MAESFSVSEEKSSKSSWRSWRGIFRGFGVYYYACVCVGEGVISDGWRML